MSEDRQPVILIVDDEEVIRDTFRAYLEDRGFEVFEACNGLEALQLFDAEEIDLILLDLKMPEMGGLDVLSRIRLSNQEVPIIVVSGAGGVKDVVEALRLGASDFIQKPFTDMSILLHSITKGLERARLLTANKNYRDKLEAEVEQKTEELRNLNVRLKQVVESAKKFIGCGEIEESGQLILEEFGRQMGAGGGSLYAVSENRLRLIHSIDAGHAVESLVTPLQPGTVLARALTEDAPFVITDIFRKGLQLSGWNGYSSTSCIVFPFVAHDGTVFAILSLHNPQTGEFAQHDREIGAILASYASEALQTANAVAKVKQNEELMLQSQKLEAVGTLAGGIAHDFNNILAAIVGYTDLSLYSSEIPEPIERNLMQIKKASQRARDLVRQILSFSRVEESNVATIDISPIIKEALKLLRATIPSSVNIEKDVPSDLGLIKADAGRIHQVLMNLCTNAAHAMQDGGGVLKVEFCTVEPNGYDPELRPLVGKPCLRLSVSDTGRGIEPGLLGRIFEPYFTTKEKSEGTGLGLAVVHAIVHGCGGVVTVESELGAGSVFHVYFPCVEESSDGPRQVTDFQMPQGSEKILFVDDEETLAEMAGEMLKKLGYSVEILTNSTEAVAFLSNSGHEYDLLITDQTMPILSGLDLARRAIEVRPGMPVILYTGYSAAISEDEARRIGIRKVLMKPLSMTLLSQAVRQVLDGTSSSIT